MSEPLSRSQQVLLVFASISTFGYAGAYYGWGPMQLLLEENGNFNSQCERDNEVCEEQTAALLNVRFVSQLTILLSPLLGELSDRKGARFAVYLMAFLAIVGLVLLTIAVQSTKWDSVNLDWLLYVSFICLGLMASCGGLLTVHTGLLFQGKLRSRVISGLNALFDAGATTAIKKPGEEMGDLVAPNVSNQSTRTSAQTSDAEFPNQNSTTSAGCTEGETYQIVSERCFWGQLKSEPVFMLSVFFAFQLASNVWTLTTARDFLKYLGDDEAGNKYLSIFTLLTPASLAALPFEDAAIHSFGFHLALQTVNVLAILHGIIRVSSESLNVQIIGFVVFSFFRCFLFSVTFSCLPNLVSVDVTGRVVGLFYLLGGVASFINIPLANAAVNRLDGNFFIPNLIYLVLNVPFIYAIWRVGKGLEREKLVKVKREEEARDRILESPP